MLSGPTFYLSRIIGNKIYSNDNNLMGRLLDLVIDMSSIKPKVVAAKVKFEGKIRIIDYSYFTIMKQKGQYLLKCGYVKDVVPAHDNSLFLSKNVLDRQIVDMDGRKVVRVNDVRLATISEGTYAVAVDVGVEGLLRRLGVAKPLDAILKPFGKSIPCKLILWDEIETIDFSYTGIKLSKAYSKLSTLVPSELADIIEDLDRKMQIEVFTSLDEEKAADVLVELESDAQINVLESLSTEKAVDMLEKMPADEVADILEKLEDERADELLNNMETEASEEIRELMEYPENSVGSLMATDFIAFNENITVNDAINELRQSKPESDTIYYLYILDDVEKLTAIVSLRDIIVAEPEIRLNQIMNRKVIFVYDSDRIDSLAEIISKYNLLAVPVVNNEMKMLGIVVIDDIVYNLLRARRKRV